ncbi:50S ribosomal protein L32-2 [Enterococcus faecium]|nr:50S ribosomal protein L32-2 [Enterococcus faecium]
MAVPARKTSKAKKRLRRTHQTVVKPEISFDEANGDYRRSHHVSLKGYYNGKKVINSSVSNYCRR